MEPVENSEKKQPDAPGGVHRFSLFIDSDDPNSLYASERLHAFLSRLPKESYMLDIFDLRSEPEIFEELNVVAVPTLQLRTMTGKKHCFVGDMHNVERIIQLMNMEHNTQKTVKETREVKKDAKNARNQLTRILSEHI